MSSYARVQLLDEVMDSGYPFTTEPGLLRTLVHNPSVVQKALTASGIRCCCCCCCCFHFHLPLASLLLSLIRISATATVGDTLPDSYLRLSRRNYINRALQPIHLTRV